MTRRFLARRALGALLALGAAATVHAQQPAPTPAPVLRHETIRGRVATDSGRPLAGFEVVATMAPDRQVQRALTDSAGRYQLVFARGTGDYLVAVSRIGFKPFRKRVTRSGADSVFVVDATLAPAVAQLAAVRVEARRQRPSRGTEFGPETGAAERLADGVSAGVSPDRAGDIAALAATVPGISSVGGGVSALGLDPSQTQTTLNGLAFPGADIPREARTTARVSTSAYDPARGGFSGAQVAVELSPGSIFSHRPSHLTLDAPQLQYGDAIARRTGQRYTNVQASIGGDGELVENRWYYNVAAQASRRLADATSLLEADPTLLRHEGVSADSVRRLLALLGGAGVPASAASVPESRVTDAASVIARLDRPTYDYRTSQPAKQTWGVTLYAKGTRSGALAFSPTTTPGHGGRSSSAIGSVMGQWSRYFGPGGGWLTELKSGLSATRDRNVPYLRLPDGRVLVASAFDGADDPGGLATLVFGGNGALEADRRGWTWETTSQTQFYAKAKQPHKVKLYAQSRLDGFRQAASANRYGTFAFASLEDLAANRPSSFARTLDAATRDGGAWSGALAVGDQWRASQRFQLLYGVRLEANGFTRAPAHNAEVERLFGARTDAAPRALHASPRLGFTWVFNRKEGLNNNSMTVSNLGTWYRGPRGTLRGGFGEFRNLVPATLLADAMAATGLPGGVRRLSCVGPAAPVPDWAAYSGDPAAIPTQCLDGTPAFRDASPAVQLYDRGFDAPRSWRGNLAWTSQLRKLDLTIEGIWSRNLDQPGVVDLNFAGTPRLVLADEGGRPVFVSAASIVPATGTVSPVEARRSAQFGRVLSHRSDLTSTSRQLTVTARPDLGSWQRILSVAYTLGDVRAEARGFDRAAFGDPRERETTWGDLDVRHRVQLQAGYGFKWGSLTLFGTFASGTPYTPVVNGDPNGDGVGGDRAFVFDPATADAALAEAMRALLAGASPQARRCLERQLGRAAERNGCRTPWTQQLNAQVALARNLLPKGQLRDRVAVSLNLANPLGGLDQLLHGSRLRGWGTPAFADPVLYTVRGFDAARQRFVYEVNPRFGDTRPSSSTLRNPFRVTLDVRVDVGRPLPEQQLDRWLRPGRNGRPGPRLDEGELRKRYARNVPDPYAAILEESDSLLLSKPQVAALEAAKQAYRAQVDSMWASLATHLAALGDQYDVAAALKRQEETIDAAWELGRVDLKRTLPAILNPVQLRLLPWPAGMLYEARQKVRIRVFMGG